MSSPIRDFTNNLGQQFGLLLLVAAIFVFYLHVTFGISSQRVVARGEQ